MKPLAVLAVLWMAVMSTAIGVVMAKHESRALFIAKVALDKQRDALNVDWGRLQLEQNTWAAHGRIEPLARERLHMRMPETRDISLLEQPET